MLTHNAVEEAHKRLVEAVWAYVLPYMKKSHNPLD